MSRFLSAKEFAVHVNVKPWYVRRPSGSKDATVCVDSSALLRACGRGLKCEAARATVVWTEMLLLVLVQRDHFLFYALLRLDWTSMRIPV